MDRDNEAGLGETTEQALRTSADLAERWHGRGRIRYAFSPRFVPSCSETLLRETVALARARGALLHTHASENLDEVALVRELTGMDNVRYLDSLGFTGPDVVLAHCIHLTHDERALLARTRTTVAHCPSSNVKLGSGICPVPELLAAACASRSARTAHRATTGSTPSRRCGSPRSSRASGSDRARSPRRWCSI